MPYRLALDAAKGKLDAARSDYNKLKTNLASLVTLAELAQKNVDLKQRDVDRKTSLVKSLAGSQADVDTALTGLVTAKLQAQFTQQQRDSTLNQLLGNADLPLEQFPEYAQAKAALRRCPAQSRSHHGARADRRHRHPGRQHPGRPLRRPPARRSSA